MKDAGILNDILNELKVDKKVDPKLPDHIVARAAMIAKEAGALLTAAYEHKYNASGEVTKSHWMDVMKSRAIASAVSSIRFLESLKITE
jgi:hypothetical protein